MILAQATGSGLGYLLDIPIHELYEIVGEQKEIMKERKEAQRSGRQ